MPSPSLKDYDVSTVQGRILFLLDAHWRSDKVYMAQQLGVSRSALKEALRENKPVTNRNVQAVLAGIKKHHKISAHWLATGEGEWTRGHEPTVQVLPNSAKLFAEKVEEKRQLDAVRHEKNNADPLDKLSEAELEALTRPEVDQIAESTPEPEVTEVLQVVESTPPQSPAAPPLNLDPLGFYQSLMDRLNSLQHGQASLDSRLDALERQHVQMADDLRSTRLSVHEIDARAPSANMVRDMIRNDWDKRKNSDQNTISDLRSALKNAQESQESTRRQILNSIGTINDTIESLPDRFQTIEQKLTLVDAVIQELDFLRDAISKLQSKSPDRPRLERDCDGETRLPINAWMHLEKNKYRRLYLEKGATSQMGRDINEAYKRFGITPEAQDEDSTAKVVYPVSDLRHHARWVTSQIELEDEEQDRESWFRYFEHHALPEWRHRLNLGVSDRDR